MLLEVVGDRHMMDEEEKKYCKFDEVTVLYHFAKCLVSNLQCPNYFDSARSEIPNIFGCSKHVYDACFKISCVIFSTKYLDQKGLI